MIFEFTESMILQIIIDKKCPAVPCLAGCIVNAMKNV